MSEDAPETPRTGNPSVDEAIDLVAGLDTESLESHPAAFEAAHQNLRQALVEAPRPAAGDGPPADGD